MTTRVKSKNPAAQFKLNRETWNVSIRSQNPMYILKFIFLTIVNAVKQIWLLPKTVSFALHQRREQFAREQFETERLDRIRNPSKYLGR